MSVTKENLDKLQSFLDLIADGNDVDMEGLGCRGMMCGDDNCPLFIPSRAGTRRCVSSQIDELIAEAYDNIVTRRHYVVVEKSREDVVVKDDYILVNGVKYRKEV